MQKKKDFWKICGIRNIKAYQNLVRIWTNCVEFLGDVKEKQKCLNRMAIHFNKEKIVEEKVLEKLQLLREEVL